MGLSECQDTGIGNERAVLGVVHPHDAPGFLAAVEHARRGERALRLKMRLSAGGGTARESQLEAQMLRIAKELRAAGLIPR